MGSIWKKLSGKTLASHRSRYGLSAVVSVGSTGLPLCLSEGRVYTNKFSNIVDNDDLARRHIVGRSHGPGNRKRLLRDGKYENAKQNISGGLHHLHSIKDRSLLQIWCHWAGSNNEQLLPRQRTRSVFDIA